MQATSEAPIEVVLVEPEIPPNTGNVMRLCANTGAALHLVGPMGFPLDDAKMRRAGLDYRDLCRVRHHGDWSAFLSVVTPDRACCFALSTKARRSFFEVDFQARSAGATEPRASSRVWLFFGPETRGLSTSQLGWFLESNRLRLPMRPESRSLNLSNSVAVAVYEVWRQLSFVGAPTQEA
ncbi:MAG: tRNA (cytidine(34)-2'-O)-methyltransferase [Betaproteobacteria bacterium]|nr:tRNA (cytidine(34)-2'-O)-methyltransferase [Betaproteobacteria bacterium]NBT75359.1 tRNA (cytidine(34)-2'-O)-methyltransferase [Betaproteobacteria bacterium]NBY13305.1 tRNA (cytidine(34)-2'-O)-methyltransferase [Betaproteobacteria bacterium]NCA16842.1 tRNA (cytidine(34)-2'-O)-methyltransferase [Betaproteobacteria bacterium]